MIVIFFFWISYLGNCADDNTLYASGFNLEKSKISYVLILMQLRDGFMKITRLLYYVSTILDRFLVRSVTIYHILQSNGNRNVSESIRYVFCFHLERYDKIINKDWSHVIHTKFPIKSIDSCWMLKRGQHEICRKIYWITKYS